MSKMGRTWLGSKLFPSGLSALARHLIYISSGYLFAITSLIMCALGAASVQAMENSTPAFQLNTFRLIAHILFGVLKMMSHGKVAPIRQENVPWIIHATVSYLMATTCYYWAASYLELSAMGTVHSLYLIVIVFALELLLRSNKTGKVQLVATILAVLGCILNIQPWCLFNNEPAKYPNLTDHMLNLNSTAPTGPAIITMDRENINSVSAGDLQMGLPILLLAAIGNAGYFHIVGKHLAEMEAGLLFTIVSSFGAVGSLLCSLYLEPFDLHILLIPRQLMLTVVHCIFSGVGILLLTVATQFIGSMRIALTISFEVIILLILQYTLMKNYKPGYRNVLEIIGALLTIVAVILSPIFDFIKQKYASHVDFDH